MRKTLFCLAIVSSLLLIPRPSEAKAVYPPVWTTAPVYSNNPFAHSYYPQLYQYGYGPFSFGYPPIGVGAAPYAYVAPGSVTSFAYIPASGIVQVAPTYHGAQFGGYGYGYYGVAPVIGYPLYPY